MVEVCVGYYGSNSKGIVMVNFMDQFDWAVGNPDVCLNIVLGVSVRVFLDEIII